jgi:hypothetical protein
MRVSRRKNPRPVPKRLICITVPVALHQERRRDWASGSAVVRLSDRRRLGFTEMGHRHWTCYLMPLDGLEGKTQ